MRNKAVNFLTLLVTMTSIISAVSSESIISTSVTETPPLSSTTGTIPTPSTTESPNTQTSTDASSSSTETSPNPSTTGKATTPSSTETTTLTPSSSTETPPTPAPSSSTETPPTPAPSSSTVTPPTPAPSSSTETPPTPAPSSSTVTPPTPAPSSSTETPPTPAPSSSTETQPTPAPSSSTATPPNPAPSSSTETPPTPAPSSSTATPPTPAPSSSTETPPTPAPSSSTEIPPTPAPSSSTVTPPTPAPSSSTETPPTPAPSSSTETPPTPAPSSSTVTPPTPAPFSSTETPPTPAPSSSTETPPTPAPSSSTETPPTPAPSSSTETPPTPTRPSSTETSPTPAPSSSTETPPTSSTTESTPTGSSSTETPPTSSTTESTPTPSSSTETPPTPSTTETTAAPSSSTETPPTRSTTETAPTHSSTGTPPTSSTTEYTLIPSSSTETPPTPSSTETAPTPSSTDTPLSPSTTASTPSSSTATPPTPSTTETAPAPSSSETPPTTSSTETPPTSSSTETPPTPSTTETASTHPSTETPPTLSTTETASTPTSTETPPTPFTTETASTPPSSTETSLNPSTTETVPVSSTSESSQTSTTSIPSTSQNPSSSSSTRETATSFIPTTTTTENPECKRCIEMDDFGVEWTACEGTVAIRKCLGNSTGQATWTCVREPLFLENQPNYDNCKSIWLSDLISKLESETEIEGPEADSLAQQLLSSTNKSADSDVKFYGHEIKLVFGLGSNLLSKVSQDVPFDKFNSLTNIIMSSFQNLLQSEAPWDQLSVTDKGETGTSFLENTRDIMFEITTRMLSADTRASVQVVQRPAVFTQDSFHILANSEPYDENLKSKFIFPNKDRSYVELSENWRNSFSHLENIEYAALQTNTKELNRMLPPELYAVGAKLDKAKKILNSDLISLTFNGTEISNLPSSESVKIKFVHDVPAWGSAAYKIRRKLHGGESPKAALGSAVCVHWDEEHRQWSGAGCSLIQSERHATTCACDHLTAFAVLTDVHDYIGKDSALEIITLILSPISIVCLILVILAIIFGKVRHGQAKATINLCTCLILGNLLLLTLVDRNYFHISDGVCIGTGIATHYLFLCVIAWAGIEGFNMFRALIYTGKALVHRGEDMFLRLLMAYGIPLLIVGITAGIGYGIGDHPYGGDLYCWIEGHYIWAFVGPVALIVLVNFTILIVALVKASKLAVHSNQSTPSQPLVFGCKEWLVFTILLGLSWAAGLLMIIDHSTTANVAAYFFTVLNASQGIFLFMIHCVFNKQLYERLFQGSSANLNISQEPIPSFSETSIIPRARLNPAFSGSQAI